MGANRGYTEQDIREQARALTGWRGIRRPADGTYDFSYGGRWFVAGTALAASASPAAPRSATALVDRAALDLGIRALTKPTRAVATRLAQDTLMSRPPQVAEQALRQLLALSPEVQTS
ncbi:MAG: DUF1800 family protein [Actinobacteria bacterium]|nr:DUF1800 family protein [Actinomycetota bacterium]